MEDRAELLGYLPIHGGLMDRYRSVNAFLHVSWTEGMPQVLLEAFAAGTPVVATAVGGVPEAAGDAALLIPAGRPRRGGRRAGPDRGRSGAAPGARDEGNRARTRKDTGSRKRPRSAVSWPIRTVPSQTG